MNAAFSRNYNNFGTSIRGKRVSEPSNRLRSFMMSSPTNTKAKDMWPQSPQDSQRNPVFVDNQQALADPNSFTSNNATFKRIDFMKKGPDVVSVDYKQFSAKKLPKPNTNTNSPERKFSKVKMLEAVPRLDDADIQKLVKKYNSGLQKEEPAPKSTK